MGSHSPLDLELKPVCDPLVHQSLTQTPTLLALTLTILAWWMSQVKKFQHLDEELEPNEHKSIMRMLSSGYLIHIQIYSIPFSIS